MVGDMEGRYFTIITTGQYVIKTKVNKTRSSWSDLCQLLMRGRRFVCARTSF